MDIEITIRGVLTVPDGTAMPEYGRGFTLPNGDLIKPFIVLEWNEEKDLLFTEWAAHGLDLCEDQFEWVEVIDA